MSEVRQAVQDRFRGTGIVVLCFDASGAAELRATAAAAHLRYIETVLDEINLAGPLYDETGLIGRGSLYVLKTADEPRAREIVENDPFFKAGVFAEVRYQRFLPAAGQFIGGKIW